MDTRDGSGATGARSLTVSGPDLIGDFESLVIPHPNHIRAKAAIASLHARFRPPGTRPLKARALLIVGNSGAGKTTALESYHRDYPDLTLDDRGTLRSEPALAARMQDGDIRRIIYVEAPKRTTQRALAAAMLGKFGYKTREHWNTSDIIDKICFYSGEMGTEMIFIDEGHHMVSEKNEDATEDNSEFIKSILNRAKTQIVIAGLPKLLMLRTHEQVRRRIQPSLLLLPYNWSTRQGRISYCAILMMFENAMGLPKPSMLSHHDKARRLYVATGGEPGITSKFLSEALSRAVARHLESICLELLGEVYEAFSAEYREEMLLDFDAILDESAMTAIVGAGSREKNPFLCSEAQLKELWALSRAEQEKAEIQDCSRRTKLRGTGRQPFSPFVRT